MSASVLVDGVTATAHALMSFLFAPVQPQHYSLYDLGVTLRTRRCCPCWLILMFDVGLTDRAEHDILPKGGAAVLI